MQSSVNPLTHRITRQKHYLMLQQSRYNSRAAGLIRYMPTWQANLIFFFGLIVVALAYFYWQVQQARHSFLDHTRMTSGIVADVIERNASNALLSQEVVTEIIATFLDNTARFVDYLNAIEPFSAPELASFAKEAGLAGICIASGGNRFTVGPKNWMPATTEVCTRKLQVMHYLPAEHIYYLVRASTEKSGCVAVGITSSRIEILQEQIGIPRLLETLSGLGGIRYLRLQQSTDTHPAQNAPQIVIHHRQGHKIAETRLVMDEISLILGMDADLLAHRIRQLLRQFFIFGALLASLGIFFSWLLHRFQKAYLEQVKGFERELARQHEDAALGRSAAAIAHEIRNPLNSISMGLQRLQLESTAMASEHRQLVDTMRKAVARTNDIVEDIRRFARPLMQLRKAPVRLSGLLNNLLPLYQSQCKNRGIALNVRIESDATINGDAGLLEEAFENLLKNGIEAQTTGGFLSITVKRRSSEAVVTVENGGFDLAPESAERILEPYYTTKTRGTGLGLSITQRIIAAHGGRLELALPGQDRLGVVVVLPISPHREPKLKPSESH